MSLKGFFKRKSLYERFLWVSIPMAVLTIAIIYYSQNIANNATGASLQAIQQNNQHKQIIRMIGDHLQYIEKQVYRHTVYHDDEARTVIDKEFDKLKEKIKQLNQYSQKTELSDANNPTHPHNIINLLKVHLRKLKTYINYYYHVIDDVSLRFPGMRLLLSELLVHNTNFLQAVDEALIDYRQTREVHRNREAEELFIQIRYAWVQQVSWFRLFIANRSGIFGSPKESMKQNLENRNIYMKQVGEYLDKLASFDANNKLDIQPSLSLAVMQEAFNEYEKNFQKAEQIYLSNDWRADYPFLNDVIQPGFERASNLISEYEKNLEVAVGESIQDSYRVAEKITSSLWLVGAIVLFVLLTAYLMFEYILRRPIEQVAQALDAEAKGESFSPLLEAKTKETSMLIDAFKNMQEQVHSRQLRLTSILENAAEGIITIDEQGNIESFNSAAEKLFGYDDSEVIGDNIAILLPEPFRANHDTLFQDSIKANENKRFDMELEVSAQSKTGKIFPVSIKISDLIVEGRRIFTAIVDDISERKAMIENLRKLAEHDSLTGLYNRFYFMEELERVVNRTHREHSKKDSLLYIDLDNFKYVNDTLGHLAGDVLLVEVTEMLSSRTRKSDLLARIGGDEFAILLYEVDAETAQSVAEQYRLLLQEYTFKYEGKVVDVGCSIGVAMLEDNIPNKDEILSRADFSCHIAKIEGRNKVHLYTDKDKEQIDILSDDIGWTRRIKSSLENNRFVIAKQPIADTSLLETNKYEVLLRMVDSAGGLIMPSGFLQPAERFGLMIDIDKWVIRHAIAMMKEELQLRPHVEYSINLSAQSFESNELLNVITNEIEKNAVNPSALTFEITETVAMADIGLAVKFLTALRELGCKTALDDFGVGYSSFAYLKDLPVDYVKIDGSFVRDVENNPLNKTILKSISDVAQAMGKKTVAEFVESAETVRILELMGVDYVQGYHIGKPVIPPSEYARLDIKPPKPKPELKVV